MKSVLHKYKPAMMAVLFVSAATANAAAIQFSAIAVQISPQRPPMEARIFVGAKAVRSEYVMADRKYVEIVFAGDKGRVLLSPATKEYMQQTGGKFVMPGTAPVKGKSPCKGVPKVTCTKVASEMLNGRKADKWEFVDNQGPKTLRSLHWFDVERNFPVRQLFPDGSVFEMRYSGKQTLYNRQVEQWEWTGTRPNGQTMHSRQWLDTQLNIAIREERPGGYVRELRDLKTGKQPVHLFNIPKDYKKIEASAAMTDWSPGQNLAGQR